MHGWNVNRVLATGKAARWFRGLGTGVLLLFAVSRPALSQETVVAAPGTSAARTAAMTQAVLGGTISLHLDRVPLPVALETIARQVNVRIQYNAGLIPKDKLVTLVTNQITVGDALSSVLAETNVRIVVPAAGRIRLEPPDDAHISPGLPQQDTATISGYVRDSATGASIAQVTVRIDGTSLETKSGGDGLYKIAGVAAGEYRVTARRVGYLARTRMVTLTAGQAATLNFDLNPPATTLDEVVTTALGDQRRYQVGNVISTINVDSIVPTAPIENITDLLAGRAPGVHVVEVSGVTGSDGAIRIRGQSSLVLQTDPIIIVDGIRQDNTPGGSYSPIGGGAVPGPNRLNDLDYSQIETIDLLKGPAASTEYGTDAANGVIVITTKHGVAGKPQWHVSADQSTSDMPATFSQYYYTYGHTSDGTTTPTACPVVPQAHGMYAIYGFPLYEGSTFGTCIADSVTSFNPLNVPEYSIYGTGSRSKYDLSVSGGSEMLRYYVAANTSNEVGIAKLPDIFRGEAEALGFPRSVLKANSEGQSSIRSNTTIRLSATSDLTVNAAYLSTNTIIPAGYLGMSVGPDYGPVLKDSADYYGYGPYPWLTPLAEMGEPQTQTTDRLTGGLSANWRPTSWFVTHGTIGIDHGSQLVHSQFLEQAQLYGDYEQPYGVNNGQSALDNSTTDIYSADLRATATAVLTRTIRSATSVGFQFNDSRSQGVTVSAGGLAAQNQTLNGVASNQLNVTQAGNQAVTLGGYLEEQIGISERLFVTGALRVDAGSGFGSQSHSTAYPKASVSWLAVNDAAATVRLRGALGQSGVQPGNGAALPLYRSTTVLTLNGLPTTGVVQFAPGNPALRPERSVEYEGGVDVGLWDNRVSLELTDYVKTTQDALANQTLGFDLNQFTYQENIGEVQNRGLEATLTAVILRERMFDWEVTLNGALNRNKLVHLYAGTLTPQEALQEQVGPYSEQRFTAGYPLYGYWWAGGGSYSDRNHDGIIEANEATAPAFGTNEQFVGSSIPTQTASIQTHLAGWRGAVALAALFDYEGGYRVYNAAGYYTSNNDNATDLASNDPSAPLWQQGRDLDGGQAFFEDGTFVRFRELSLTYVLPSHVLRALRIHALSVTGAVRNLTLWKRYTGPDPEVSDPSGQYDPPTFNTGNIQAANNDLRIQTASAVPLARYWVVRLNLGL